MSNTRNWIINLDWFTISLYGLLVFLGWINIYAAVYNEEHEQIIDLSQRYGKQLLWIGAAIVIAFVVLLIEVKFYHFFAYAIYGFIILVLIFVLIFARDINGAASWIEIGSFRIQPSEFAKFATALALARLMSRFNFDIGNKRDLAKAVIVIMLPLVLIILQNDLGSALVYFSLFIVLYRKGLPGWILLLAVFFAILFIASFKVNIFSLELFVILVASILLLINSGKINELAPALAVFTFTLIISWITANLTEVNIELHYLVFIALVLSSIVYIYWIYRKKLEVALVVLSLVYASILFLFSVEYIFSKVLGTHQQNRILVLIGEKEDPRGIGYNVNQSKIAIGSGGLIGKGFLQGTQTKYKFVPEQSTDFIFCTVGEEWGFVGTTTVIILFLVLFWRILIMAERQKMEFSMYYGYAVASILFFHFVVNIGMTIGLAPVVGIPLPFFSYGGSSLWSFTVMLFIFIKLDATRQNIL